MDSEVDALLTSEWRAGRLSRDLFASLLQAAPHCQSAIAEALERHASSGDLRVLHEELNRIIGEARSASSLRIIKTFSSADMRFSDVRTKIILFYAEEMSSIAEDIRRLCGGAVALGEIDWFKFPDGTPKLFIQGARELKHFAVVFLASMHNTAVFFDQIAIIHALPGYLAKRFTVILPYFPTGTNERIFNYGHVATACTLARMLSIAPQSCSGPTQLCIFDIHALQEQFYFSDDIKIRLKSCVYLLRNVLTLRPDKENITIVFPDEGAMKRFGTKFSDFPLVVFAKQREGSKRVVRLLEGDPKGRHCVLVDDLVMSGSTLIESLALCRSLGAIEISAYVTHAVFPNDTWKRFL